VLFAKTLFGHTFRSPPGFLGPFLLTRFFHESAMALPIFGKADFLCFFVAKDFYPLCKGAHKGPRFLFFVYFKVSLFGGPFSGL